MENEYVEVRESGIHSKGVFAKKVIPKDTKLLEYIGKKVNSEEANKIYEEQLEAHKKDPTKGGVYIFELDDEYSIDGDLPGNTCKYTNHSCKPNCWIDIIDGRIWVIASRDIQPDEEITYDYGYDMDDDWVYGGDLTILTDKKR